MGIQGLHKGLGFATQKSTLRDFRGKTLAIDSSSWLHRSVYSVSQKYVEGIERNHIDPHCVHVSAKYIISRVHELLNCFGISQIYLVMDGKRCPLKADTNCERERNRQANLTEARALIKQGRRDKAEEKYKMCIKIKDELTIAVMNEVRQSFRNHQCVHLIWSPYEADAQLAKLCVDRVADAVITEDSDVLVYSAATHCAFPVIYKLDRHTGSCDVISMEWLLNYREGQETVVSSQKQKSALETLLINMASRQAKRPGFGVRLFVQGCVLAGCDYAPNRLSGVGLVNAFKYVRDNAFRNDSVRFQKILDSMPRKNKANIDVKEYEKILAQSESVFYYHVVKHQDQSHRPLCDPRVTEIEAEVEHSLDHHLPLMTRFEDWSFVGDVTTPQSTLTAPPIQETIVGGGGNKHAVPAANNTFFVPFLKKKGPTQNPYTKAETGKETSRKRPRDDSRVPLQHLDQNGGKDRTASPRLSKIFSDVAGKQTHCTKPLDGIQTYENMDDPRFVRRRFPPSNGHCPHMQKDMTPIESECSASANLSDNDIPASSAIEPLFTSQTSSLSDDKNAPHNKVDVAAQSPSYFDLTDDNSMPFQTFDDGIIGEDEDGFIIHHERPTRVSLDGSVDIRQTKPDEDGSNPMGDDTLGERPPKVFRQNPNTSSVLVTQSAYFQGHSGCSSREECEETSKSPYDSENCAADYASRRCTVAGLQPVRLRNNHRTTSSRYPSLAAGSGPLARAFQTQRERYSTRTCSFEPYVQARPWVRPFPPITNRTVKRVNTGKLTVKSFFPKVDKNLEAGL